MKKFFILLLKPFSFLPALLVMYLIFSFSSQTGTESGNLSYKISHKIIVTADTVLDKNMSEEQIAQMNGSMSDFQENSGYGIKNVNRRIELLFGRSYGLRYYRNGESGVIAEIRLPASWEGEDDV